MRVQVRRDTKRSGRGPNLNRDRWYTPYLFIAPMMLIFAVFILLPIAESLLSSFFTWGLLNPWRLFDPETWNFAGLGNYEAAFASEDVREAALNTATWLLLLPALVVVVSLVLSLLLWSLRRGSAVLRIVFVAPMTISLASAGVIWGLLYNTDPSVGVLNGVLSKLGILGDEWIIGPMTLRPGMWLAGLGTIDLGFASFPLTNLALIAVAVWAFTGFGVITLTAGLTSISPEIIEAAQVDGASKWQTVRHIMLPLLKGPIAMVYVICIVYALRTFDLVFTMTGGGPGRETSVLALVIYQKGYQFLNSPQGGQAAALAVIMAAVMLLCSFPYLRGTSGKDN